LLLLLYLDGGGGGKGGRSARDIPAPVKPVREGLIVLYSLVFVMLFSTLWMD